MKMMIGILLTGLLLGLTGPVRADLLAKALHYYHLDTEVHTDANQNAKLALESFLVENPGHTHARVIWGCVLTKMGRDAWLPWNKMDLVNRGLQEMDEAIAADEKDFLARRVRLENNVRLPRFFDREAIILSDIKFIENYQKTNGLPEIEWDHLQALMNQYLEISGKGARR